MEESNGQQWEGSRGRKKRDVAAFPCLPSIHPSLGAKGRRARRGRLSKGRASRGTKQRQSRAKREHMEARTRERRKGLLKGKEKAKAMATRVLLLLQTVAAHFLPARIRFAISCSPCVWFFPILPLASTPFCLAWHCPSRVCFLLLLTSLEFPVCPLQFSGLASPLPSCRR